MIFGIGDKVYVISDKGNRKEGKVVSNSYVKDYIRYYNCMFSNVSVSLPESKLNPLIEEGVK